MNVSQLETLLDMTRANIRFYEQEGLVCPRREKNGYRDYSEEDTDTLRKIKLLRQLGLSLESIRRLQRGELSLDAALREREAQLAAERSELVFNYEGSWESNISGGDAVRGHTRSHPEHDG